MKKLNIEQNSPEWLEARYGKITGSKLKGIVVKRGTEKKLGYYELIAESIGIPPTDESPMARGSRLEEEAVALFQEKYKKIVNKDGIWISDIDELIILSPDGCISETEAVEVKCLSSSRHIQAILTNEVPDDYHYQCLQYFIVNDQLETLYFVFYDPRITYKPLHVIELNRNQFGKEIEEIKQYQIDTLSDLRRDIKLLTSIIN